MVVLSPLHHEKIQHMVLYVQCGVSILQSVQIALDTKRFGFALDRSMSVPFLSDQCRFLGVKSIAEYGHFNSTTPLSQHSHIVTPSGDAPRCGYCVLIITRSPICI